MSEMLKKLATRRSVLAKQLGAPGPDRKELDEILKIAARVPDHGKLAPWRFIVLEGEARAALGQELAHLLEQQDEDLSEAKRKTEEERFLRAPVVICVVSRAREHVKIPIWEQQLSAGAVCLNMLLAASALGYGAQWLTEWCAFDPQVHDVLGVQNPERVAGFIYIGTANEVPEDRARPDMSTLVTYWKK